MIIKILPFLVLAITSPDATIKLFTKGNMLPTQKELARTFFNFSKENRTDCEFDDFFGGIPVFPFTPKSILFIKSFDFEPDLDSIDLLKDIVRIFEELFQRVSCRQNSHRERDFFIDKLFFDIERKFSSDNVRMKLIIPEQGESIDKDMRFFKEDLEEELRKQKLIGIDGRVREELNEEIREKIISTTSDLLRLKFKKESLQYYPQPFSDNQIYIRILSVLPKKPIRDIKEFKVELRVMVGSKLHFEVKKKMKEDLENELSKLNDNVFDQFLAKKKLESLLNMDFHNAGICLEFKRTVILTRKEQGDKEIEYVLDFLHKDQKPSYNLDFFFLEDVSLMKQIQSGTNVAKKVFWSTVVGSDTDEYMKVALPAFVDHFGVKNDWINNFLENGVAEEEVYEKRHITDMDYELHDGCHALARSGFDPLGEREMALFQKLLWYYNIFTTEALYEEYKLFAKEKEVDDSRNAFKEDCEPLLVNSRYICLNQSPSSLKFRNIGRYYYRLFNSFGGYCVERYEDELREIERKQKTGDFGREEVENDENTNGRNENDQVSDVTRPNHLEAEGGYSFGVYMFFGVFGVVLGVSLGVLIKQKERKIK